MTLGILHALKGPRNVEELLRTIPTLCAAGWPSIACVCR